MNVRYRFRGYATVMPDDWGLPAPDLDRPGPIEAALGTSGTRLNTRITRALTDFVGRLFDPDEGALRHYYRADTKFLSELDSGNFLMAQNLVVQHDLLDDDDALERAMSCYAYAMEHFCELQPMFFWQGGVRDGFRPSELWVKYTGDAAWLASSLYRRTGDEAYLFDLRRFHNFFKRAREAGFAYTFDSERYVWRTTGNVWRSFGFPITVYLEMYEHTGDDRYLDEALRWGRHGLDLQEEDGSFLLIDGQFWNSDLTGPELRGLVNLWEATGDETFLDAARRFGTWLVSRQRDDGAWPLGIDRDGDVCVETVGPGDPPNLALSLIRLHGATGNDTYLRAAVRAVRYGLSMQACEEGAYPLHLDDPHVRWGFWSWEPLQDTSLSGDQSIHHVRGTLFLAAYLRALAQTGDVPPDL